MMITDEMVEVACSVWFDTRPAVRPDLTTIGHRMRLILEAALTAALATVTGESGVKGLLSELLLAGTIVRRGSTNHGSSVEINFDPSAKKEGERLAERLVEIAALQPQPSAPAGGEVAELLLLRAASQWQPTHRHKKRGTEYVLVGYGRMQTQDWTDGSKHSDTSRYAPSVDMREVAIYRSVDDGELWVRPKEEFEDGRFETLPSPPESPK